MVFCGRAATTRSKFREQVIGPGRQDWFYEPQIPFRERLPTLWRRSFFWRSLHQARASPLAPFRSLTTGARGRRFAAVPSNRRARDTRRLPADLVAGTAGCGRSDATRSSTSRLLFCRAWASSRWWLSSVSTGPSRHTAVRVRDPSASCARIAGKRRAARAASILPYAACSDRCRTRVQ